MRNQPFRTQILNENIGTVYLSLPFSVWCYLSLPVPAHKGISVLHALSFLLDPNLVAMLFPAVETVCMVMFTDLASFASMTRFRTNSASLTSALSYSVQFSFTGTQRNCSLCPASERHSRVQQLNNSSTSTLSSSPTTSTVRVNLEVNVKLTVWVWKSHAWANSLTVLLSSSDVPW